MKLLKIATSERSLTVSVKNEFSWKTPFFNIAEDYFSNREPENVIFPSLIPKFKNGIISIKVMLDDVFEETLYCQWLVEDDQLMKASSSLKLSILQNVLNIYYITESSVTSFSCERGYKINTEIISDDLQTANVHIHKPTTPLLINL